MACYDDHSGIRLEFVCYACLGKKLRLSRDTYRKQHCLLNWNLKMHLPFGPPGLFEVG